VYIASVMSLETLASSTNPNLIILESRGAPKAAIKPPVAPKPASSGAAITVAPNNEEVHVRPTIPDRLGELESRARWSAIWYCAFCGSTEPARWLYSTKL